MGDPSKTGSPSLGQAWRWILQCFDLDRAPPSLIINIAGAIVLRRMIRLGGRE